MASRITRVNFTFALPGGMWIERADGRRSWESSETLLAELGSDELERLSQIAHRHGMTGMWREVPEYRGSVRRSDGRVVTVSVPQD